MYYDKGLYKRTTFLLHQAAENYYYCIRLVFTLKEIRQHNLQKYYQSIRKYCKALRPFSNPDPEVLRLFHLVKDAYGEALHNPDFTVTKEDVDGLFPMVYQLRDITKKVCEEKIEEFRRKAEERQLV
ncbi:MAG: hypothetical protein LUD15_09355 [Bacteroides sp.]|nr:hypothetical protein [Bacteroides sp.]